MLEDIVVINKSHFLMSKMNSKVYELVASYLEKYKYILITLFPVGCVQGLLILCFPFTICARHYLIFFSYKMQLIRTLLKFTYGYVWQLSAAAKLIHFYYTAINYNKVCKRIAASHRAF